MKPGTVLDIAALGVRVEIRRTAEQTGGELVEFDVTRSRVVRHEPPRVLEVDVDGDLRGHGLWTLTAGPDGTHVRFDWRVHADRRLLRVLTPVLRPAFRWNHDWAIARAKEGLEPYARSLAARPAVRAQAA